MNPLIKIVAACALSFSMASASASIVSFQEKHRIQQYIDKLLIGSYFPPYVGIVVQSMQTGEIIYEKNPNHLMMPASVQKLLTGIAALAYLGPNFSFNTTLLTNNKTIQNGVLTGDLIVKFSGDPSLRPQDIANLFNQLADHGIRRIQGKVYIDNSDYNNIPYGPGWIWEDFNHPYAAPLNAIIINENAFGMRLIPSSKGYVTISSTLPQGVATFSNQLTTIKSRYGCPITVTSDQSNHYTVAGCFGKGWGIQGRMLAIKDPDSYAKALVKAALMSNQIAYNGTITMHSEANAHYLLVNHASPPLQALVTKMLKKSDNMIANTLLKKLGQVYFNTQGTWTNGVSAVKAILSQKAHIDFEGSSIADGAGLSRYNLIAPSQLSKLLFYAYHDRKVAPYLLNALPLAGVDGTLKYRMKSTPHLQIRGKTGTMHSVSALAGYINTANHHTLSYVIMINGYAGRCWPYTRLEDKICQYLAHNV